MSLDNEAVTDQPRGGENTGLTTSEIGPGYHSVKEQTPPTSENATYLPQGLKSLSSCSELRVNQFVDIVEVLLCFERNNRYQVTDARGNQIFYVYESGPCYARKILGASRGLMLKASDNDSQDLIVLHRPLRCSSRCLWLCCNLQEMEIHSPPGTPVATVREVWTCGIPVYHIFNLRDEWLYKIQSAGCHCRAFTDITFHIYDSSSHQEKVAVLTKYWGGGKEIFGASNNFSLKYLKNLDVEEKVILFGAVFLIDLNHFERHCRC